ncbi:MAG: hypothetical protein P8X97_00340 [Candidatus Bathyarchaeota archaeon]
MTSHFLIIGFVIRFRNSAAATGSPPNPTRDVYVRLTNPIPAGSIEDIPITFVSGPTKFFKS